MAGNLIRTRSQRSVQRVARHLHQAVPWELPEAQRVRATREEEGGLTTTADEAATADGADPAEPEGRLRQSFHLSDLVPLSVSSVGPLFSVAATGGVMAAQAGWWTLPAIAVLAVPFIISSFVFRLLNQHFPHAGASYHWSARVIGKGVSRYQAWILILAYFFSIPPIAIPAGAYTLALVAPHYQAPAVVQMAVTLFWILFAAVPLLLGGRPTARITQVFFAVEMVSLISFGIIGVLSWHRLAVPIHFGPPPIGGILIVAVIAATILDGWEIDSYAAEESQRPRKHPGIGGVIGAFGALAFYAVLYPLILGETPIRLLANSTDPLTAWSHRLVPGAPWAMLVPILLSTAGGLWLTSFILSRALFAMGRENLIPSGLARLKRHRRPHRACPPRLKWH
jgi:amino acid transporter